MPSKYVGILPLLAALAGCGLKAAEPAAARQPAPSNEPASPSNEPAPPAPQAAPAPPAPPALAAIPSPPLVVSTLPILAKPLNFNEERIRLTLEYRKVHQGYTGTDITIVPKVVVLHWTGGSTAMSAWNTFAPTRAADARPELAAAGDVNVSAHFIVNRDGSIWQLMPENWMARHCIGLNHLSIGIENVGSSDLEGSNSPLTEAQLKADIALVRDLSTRWPIEKVIGHLEYRTLEKTSYFLELDPNYRTGKPDPGPAFTAAVRAGSGF